MWGRFCVVSFVRSRGRSIARDKLVYIFVKTQGMIIYKNIITIEPGKRSGKPCIRNMRITVEDILRYLASGMSMDEILEDFPELTREDILVALEFSANRLQRIAIAA